MTLKQEIENLINRGKKWKKTHKNLRDIDAAEESTFNLGTAQNIYETRTQINDWWIKELQNILKTK